MALPAVIGGIARGVSALGGSGGAAAGAAKALSEAGNLVFAAQAVAGGIKSLTDSLKNNLYSVITAGAAPIKMMASAVMLVQTPALAVVGALKEFRNAIGALGGAMSEFVRLASPVHVQLFNLAMDDLTASIGKALMPALEAATGFVRMFADVIFKLAAPLQRLIAAFAGPLNNVFKSLANVGGTIVAALTPVIDAVTAFVRPFMKLGEALFKIVAFGAELAITGLAKALDLLMAPLAVVGKLLEDFADSILKFVNNSIGFIRRLFGMRETAGTSVGAAVRPAQFTSIEEYGKRAQQAAFSLGTASSPEERTADFASKLYTYITTRLIPDLVSKFPELAMELGKALVRVLPGGDTMVKAAGGIAEAIADPVAAGRRLSDRAEAAAESTWDAVSLKGIRRRLF